MNTVEATQFVSDMFASVPTVTPEVVAAAVTYARVVDAGGNAPIDPDYVETVDQWLAAAHVAAWLEASTAVEAAIGGGALQQFTAEGASFQFGPARSWGEVAGLLRSRSPLWTNSGVGVIEVPTGTLPHRPRSQMEHWDW